MSVTCHRIRFGCDILWIIQFGRMYVHLMGCTLRVTLCVTYFGVTRHGHFSVTVTALLLSCAGCVWCGGEPEDNHAGEVLPHCKVRL